jgi:undecaprenyl-diphosphatase
MWTLIKEIDTELFFLINRQWKNGLFDICMPIISNFHYFLIPIAILLLVMILKKDAKSRLIAVTIFAVIATTDILSARVLKPLVQRPRPYHVLSNVNHYKHEWRITPEKMRVSTSTNFSMPSSHATNMFAAAVFLSWFFPGYAWFFLVLALIVSYSRPYLGVHYPLDVAAGAVLGSAIGILYALLATWILQRIQGRWAGSASASKSGKAPGPPQDRGND